MGKSSLLNALLGAPWDDAKCQAAMGVWLGPDSEDGSEALTTAQSSPQSFVTQVRALLPPTGPASGGKARGKAAAKPKTKATAARAAVSRAPGTTRQAHVYYLSGQRTLVPELGIVDFPGYGFARARPGTVAAWTQATGMLLDTTPTLRRVFVLVDARRGLAPLDLDFLDNLQATGVSCQLVLTKCDLLPTDELHRRHSQIRANLVAVTGRPRLPGDALVAAATGLLTTQSGYSERHNRPVGGPRAGGSSPRQPVLSTARLAAYLAATLNSSSPKPALVPRTTLCPYLLHTAAPQMHGIAPLRIHATAACGFKSVLGLDI